MNRFMAPFLLCCCSSCCFDAESAAAETPDSLRVSAFNVQVFGQKKISNAEVVDILVQIILKYDIILIQEIRDSKGTAIKKLLQEVNKRDRNYHLVVSERLGRSRSKEQYAFIYRTDRNIKIMKQYQDPDPDDQFERPPFGLLLHVPWLDVRDFALVGVHIDPDVAPDELEALVPAHARFAEHFNTDNILVMGDMNAGGSYVSNPD